VERLVGQVPPKAQQPIVTNKAMKLSAMKEKKEWLERLY